MISLQQAILVEGKYDKNKLEQFIDAPIFETKGFGILNNNEMLSFLRNVAAKRGLIILTDSDGAGFVIRNYLKGAINPQNVYHAYIPDIHGKEKRKDKPGKEGKLGVEGMTEEIILEALRKSGAVVKTDMTGEKITKADLFKFGYSGKNNSAEKRKKLMYELNLPEKLGANGFLEALNIMLTRDEFIERFGDTNG